MSAADQAWLEKTFSVTICTASPATTLDDSFVARSSGWCKRATTGRQNRQISRCPRFRSQTHWSVSHQPRRRRPNGPGRFKKRVLGREIHQRQAAARSIQQWCARRDRGHNPQEATATGLPVGYPCCRCGDGSALAGANATGGGQAYLNWARRWWQG
jgi:hypothetical protein